MIMNKKIKKIALKLASSLKSNDFDELSRTIIKYTNDNKEYFSQFKPNEIVKMILYVYSVKKFGNIDIGDELIEKSYVGAYFSVDLEDFYSKECVVCAGSGYQTCSMCDSDGQVYCDECNANGKIECDECDGFGEIDDETCDNCNGTGEIDCDNCGGDGKNTCNDCSGNGEINCEECDGSGQEETDENNFMIYSFITWDSSLVKDLFNSYELERPIIEQDDDIINNNETFFRTNIEESHSNFSSIVESEKKYCFNLSPLNESEGILLTSVGGIKVVDYPMRFINE